MGRRGRSPEEAVYFNEDGEQCSKEEWRAGRQADLKRQGSSKAGVTYYNADGSPCSEREWLASQAVVYKRPARSYRQERAFGLRSAEYDALAIAACGRCEQCGLPDDNGSKRELGVYRDFGTGRVLGMLCAQCRGHYYARLAVARQRLPSPKAGA